MARPILVHFRYYHDGEFGIRIESLILVVKAATEHNFKNKGFLTFEPITLVPLCKVGYLCMCGGNVGIYLADVMFPLIFYGHKLLIFFQNLFDPSLLTPKEIEWIDSYHATVLERVGAHLKERGETEAYEWVVRETRTLS